MFLKFYIRMGLLFISFLMVGCATTNSEVKVAKIEKKQIQTHKEKENIVATFDKRLNLGMTSNVPKNDSISSIGYNFFTKKKGIIK